MKEEILIFNKLSDEMAFYFNDSNAKLYEASEYFEIEGESCLFYAARRIIFPEEKEKSSVDYLFNEDDHLFKFHRSIFDIKQGAPESMLLLLTTGSQPVKLPVNSRFLNVYQGTGKYEKGYEIPMEKDSYSHCKKNFLQQNPFLFYEYFESISLAELLDIDLD